MWSLLDINVSLSHRSVRDVGGCPDGTRSPASVGASCRVCGFVSFLRKKQVRSVQRLLLYPDDGGPAGRPPQLAPQHVLAELGRVHAATAGAHDLEAPLLQPLQDLRVGETALAGQALGHQGLPPPLPSPPRHPPCEVMCSLAKPPSPDVSDVPLRVSVPPAKLRLSSQPPGGMGGGSLWYR